MGIATMLIGLIPAYDAIGATAPVLLPLLRLAQGIAIGRRVGRSGFGDVPGRGVTVGLAPES
jgi:hypothetical protein